MLARLARLTSFPAGRASAEPTTPEPRPDWTWWRSPPARARSVRPPGGFAYDNERPRHRTDVRGYLIGRTPVTNASYLTFVEGGGYERREWWSDEGWAWKEEYDITRPGGLDGGPAAGVAPRRTRTAAPGPTRRPRLLVRGRRLRPRARRAPSHRDGVGEGGDLGCGRRMPPPRLRYPWGDRPGAAAGSTRTSTTRDRGTAPAPAPTPSRCLAVRLPAMIGDVWEWTRQRLRRLPRIRRATPTRSTPRCSSAATTGCCAAARGRRARGCRDLDLPQLGLPAAAPDLRRRADREDATSEPADAEPRDPDRLVSSTESDERSLANDVLDGLTRPFKELPPKHFYDARGSELFERICELPEYYPTRTEREILSTARRRDRRRDRRRRARRARIGRGREGANPARRDGARRHAPPLHPARRVRERRSSRRPTELVDEYEELAVHGVIGDFERHLEPRPRARRRRPRIVALLGGTIGNFPPGTRRRLLREIGSLARAATTGCCSAPTWSRTRR